MAAVDTFVITCEHGGNRVPTAYRELFGDQTALLDSHRCVVRCSTPWTPHAPLSALRADERNPSFPTGTRSTSDNGEMA